MTIHQLADQLDKYRSEAIRDDVYRLLNSVKAGQVAQIRKRHAKSGDAVQYDDEDVEDDEDDEEGKEEAHKIGVHDKDLPDDANEEDNGQPTHLQ